MLKDGTGTWTFTNANTYTGPTTVNGGTLALSVAGSIDNSSLLIVRSGATFDASTTTALGITLGTGRTLEAGNGAAAAQIKGTLGLVGAATLNLGTTGVAGTLSVNSTTTLQQIVGVGPTLNFDLANDTTVGGGVNDYINITGGGLNMDPIKFNISPLSGMYHAGTYHLIDWVGTTSLPQPISASDALKVINGASARQTYTLSETHTGSGGEIDLVVTGTSLNSTWVGGTFGAYVNTWNSVGTNKPWSGANDFVDGDIANFTDTGSNSPAIKLQGNLNPSAINFTNSSGHDYTFGDSGAIVAPTSALTLSGTGKVTFSNSLANAFGSISLNAGTLAFGQPVDMSLSAPISGAGSLRKEGANVLTLAGNNTAYTGVITVVGGTLQAGTAGALGDVAAGTVINGGTLDANSFDLRNELITVQGAGAGSNGALINSNAVGTGILANITLAGNTSFGGAGILSIRSIAGGNYAVTKVGTSETGFAASAGETGLGDINVNGGTMYFYGNATMGNPANTITVANNAVLGVYSSAVTHAKPITVAASGGQIGSNYGRNTISAGVAMNGNTVFSTEGANTTQSYLYGYLSALTMSGQLTGSGNLTKTNGAADAAHGGILYLTNDTNNYSGTTSITAGVLSIGNGGTTGSLGGSGTVVNDGVLAFNLNRAYKTSDLLGTRNITGTGGVDYGGMYIIGVMTDGNQVRIPNAVVSIDRDYSYTGTTNINQGKVILKSANGLGGDAGTSTYGITTIGSYNDLKYTGELDLDNPAGMIIGESFVIEGSGGTGGFNYNGPGIIRNVVGNNTITGNIDINSTAVNGLIVAAGGTLNLAGVIKNVAPTKDVSLVLGGTTSGQGTVTGQITDNLGSGGQIIARTAVEKVGTGTWTIAGGAYNNGPVTIYDGTLAVTNGAAMAMPAAITLASSSLMSTSATFDVSSYGGTFTVGAVVAQMLAGPGTVKGNIAMSGTGLSVISTGGPTTLTLTDYGDGYSPTTTTTNYNSPYGTMNIQGTLALGSGMDKLQFTLNDTAASPGNGKINVTGLVSGGSQVAIVPNTKLENGGTVGSPKVYTLMTGGTGTALSAGAFSFVNGDNTQGTRYTMSLGVSGDSKSLLLNVTGSNASLVWDGTASTVWDLGSSVAGSTSWTGAADQKFFQADDVTFDDAGTTAVDLTARVMPASITVNNSTGHDYTITGAGAITGGTGITKTGTGTLTIATTGGNDFTGKVSINGGMLTVGNAYALGTDKHLLDGGTEINGGTLNLNGQNVRYERISVQGTGYDPAVGAIVNNGSTANTVLTHVELTGDATFGGTQGWRIESWNADIKTVPYFDQPYLNGNGHNLTKVGVNDIDFVDMGETNFGDIHITSGYLYFVGTTTMGNAANTIYISNNARLGMQGSSLLSSVVYAKPIVVEATGGEINTYGGTSTLTAGITLNGDVAVNTNNSATMNLNGIITGTGGLKKTVAGSTVVLGNANNFTGDTNIVAGTLALTNVSALGGSTLNLVPANAGTLDFSVPASLTLGGLKGTVNFDMTGKNVSIGNNGQNTQYDGVLSNGTLTKIGVGNLTLTAAMPTVGNVAVNGGALYIAGNGTLGNVANTVTIANNAVLGFQNTMTTHTKPIVVDVTGGAIDSNLGNNAIGSSITLNGNALFTAATGNALTLSGVISGAAGHSATFGSVSEAGTVVLSNVNTYHGATLITNGKLELASGGDLASDSAITTSTGAKFQIDTGAHTLAAISGTGNTYVLGTSTVTAPSIKQHVLQIGGSAPVVAVPEPSTWLLLVLGCGSFALFLRRKAA